MRNLAFSPPSPSTDNGTLFSLLKPCIASALSILGAWFGCASALRGEIPALINHQGRIAVNGSPFDGAGYFKFALVSGDGNATYWSNDGTSAAGGQPAASVTLQVYRGLYSILLGDTALPNMSELSAPVFENGDVRLRVWFNDGSKGFQKITPDQRLASVPYALKAASIDVNLAQVLAAPAKPVVAWGQGASGQTNVPVIISDANTAAIAAGGDMSLALLKDGTVVQWGAGASIPGGLTGVTGIAAGTSHALAVKSDGTVTAWGDNSFGQCDVPVGLTNVTAVAAGEKHSMALRENGTVVVWGNSSFGQTEVPGSATSIVKISAGADHCMALRGDGVVVAWGRNELGQTDVPAGLTGVTALAAGAYHSIAVKSDGTVVAWGWKTGLLGDGSKDVNAVPDGISNVLSVSAGYATIVALKQDGTVFVWGDNSYKQAEIPADAVNVIAISAGASHLLALRRDMVPAQVARLDQDNVFKAKVGVKRTPAVNALEVEGQASKTTAGNWLANSDRRIKTEIHPITNAREKLGKVRLVDFRYTDEYRENHPGIEDRRYANVIAQDFAKVFPNDVRSSGERMPDGSEVLQVDTYPLTIYSAAAVQELCRENDELKKRLAEQEERIRKIEDAIRR